MDAIPPPEISPLLSLSSLAASAAATGPMSAAMSASSMASRSPGSRGRRPRARSSMGMLSTERVRDSPAFNRSTSMVIGRGSELRVHALLGLGGVVQPEPHVGRLHEGDDQVVAVLERPQDDVPAGVAAEDVVDLAGRVPVVDLACPGEGYALVGADQARPLAQVTRPDDHLPGGVEEQRGLRALHGADQALEQALVGH